MSGPPLVVRSTASLSTHAPAQVAQQSTTTSPDTIPIPEPHFLVVSLGNPAPYGEGLHSAGHHVLQSLQKHLQHSHNQPHFASERIAKKATQVSKGPKYTLMQCPTLMNISGPWVAKAWKEASEEASNTHTPLGLVVVHDDLEEDICVVKTRNWETSHRGHNGLKSIMASMKPSDYKGSRWAKIRVGIGRPDGRDHDTVSDFVLKPMTRHQKDLLADKSGGPVLAILKQIEAAWLSEKGSGAQPEPESTTKQSRKGKKGK